MEFTIKNILAAHPEVFDVFQKDLWDKKRSVSELEASLQSVVNVLSEGFGIPSNICTIKIASLNNPRKKGEFNYDTKELLLEKSLVVDKLKPPYYKDNITIENVVSNRETMEILVHEFRHAMQEFYRNNPEMVPDKDWLTLMNLNMEQGQSEKFMAYFYGNDEISSWLYTIQPIERDAFQFADCFCKEWANVMHQRFPDDLSFYVNSGFSNFNQVAQKAARFFGSETIAQVFQDVDNVLKKINGEDVSVNEKMWGYVQKTQTRTTTTSLAKEQVSGTIKHFTNKLMNNVTKLFPFDMKTAREQQSVNPSAKQKFRADKDEYDRTQ